MTRQRWIWAASAYALLRWILATLPGYTYDIQAYKRWALHAARDGLSKVYQTSDIDYPPVYAYLLYPLGKIYGWLSPEALATLGDSTLLTFLIKLPPLLFDLGIALVLSYFGHCVEGKERRFPLRWVLPALYLANPAVLLDTAYWGQPDSIHSFFLLLSFVLLGNELGAPRGSEASPGEAARRPAAPRWWRGAVPAWVFLTLATLMKPLAAPFFPLLLVLSLTFHGPRSTILGVGAAGATTLLLCAPFLLGSEPGVFLQRLLGDVGAMPFTSSNAHNLWWALGGWRQAEEPWLGSLTPTQIGLGLFGILYLAILYRAHRLNRKQEGGITPMQGLLLAVAVGFGFFMLSTHMHENHLFAALPLLLPTLALSSPRATTLRRLWVSLSLGVFLNLILHDLTVPERWPFTLGGPSQVENVHLHRPFFVGELWAIRFSTAWNLALFVLFLYSIFRSGSRGLLEGLAARPLDRKGPEVGKGIGEN